MGTRVLVALALLWGVFGVNVAFSVDWSVVPSINARTEFNSNLNYDFTAPRSDFIFTLSPAAEFNYTTEISQLQGRLGLTGLHYLSHSNIDHIDQNYQINGRYQVAPRWNLNLRSAYIVDTTLEEELTASGLIMTRTPRQSILVGPAVTYDLTERLAATLNYNFNRVNYQDPRFQNYTYQIVGLRLDYQLKNQKTLLVGNVLGRETTYSSDDRYRSLGIYLGAKHKFTENWDATLFAGLNVSSFNFSTQVLDSSQFPFFILVKEARVHKTEVSPYVNVSTTRRWTNLSLTAGFSRDESPTAYASISELNRVYGFMNYNFSERLSGSLMGEYYLTNQSSERTNLKNDYLSISPQINYRITEKLTASPGYRFGIRDDITGGRTATVQAVWLMVTYSYPIHYQR
jgi:hypothetical protein